VKRSLAKYFVFLWTQQQTPDSTGAMMAQGYPRSGYQTPENSTILPPLQRSYNQTAAARGYFDQAPPTASSILPSQMAPEGARYGSANETPQ